jgi:tetratricopeptide (TPR) repeat protein
LSLLICLALALVTLAVYWPVSRHEFINFDDQLYITANHHVQAGLTWSGVIWAFTNDEAQNWHPLTWLSHMVDCQLYGLNPGGHHVTNLFFHVVNTLLLFLWLKQLTGASWRSAWVAAFFAWHPLHIESVAWVAERKDVLSAFFWMLTLLAYTRYARKPAVAGYLLVLLLFTFGLMSKPMVVTLPFVLLLIDFWPLNRLCLPATGASEHFPVKSLARPAAALVVEKIPFFVLAFADSAVTYLIQKTGGALWSTLLLPPQERVANALLSYARYISKTLWPADLAVIYPHPRHWPVILVLGTALVLAAWTILFFWRARRYPYLVMGWLWFLGTLIPAIGLVQVGSQSMADRYTYIPGIGLFILIVWGLNDLFNVWPERRKFIHLAGVVALIGCLGATSIQLNYWRNSTKLFLHTIEVTTDNYVAYNCLGKALEETGRQEEAAASYAQSVRIESHYPAAQYNLGMALSAQGKWDEAGEHLAVVVKLVPDNAEARYYLGSALMNAGKSDKAADQFSEALRLKPDFAAAHLGFAVALVKQNKTPEAIPHFTRAVSLQPNDPAMRFNLGLALLDNHQPAEAAVQFAEELKLTPNETKAHYRLAQALERQNKPAEAVAHYRETLRLTPQFPEAQAALDQIFSAHPELKSLR